MPPEGFHTKLYGPDVRITTNIWKPFGIQQMIVKTVEHQQRILIDDALPDKYVRSKIDLLVVKFNRGKESRSRRGKASKHVDGLDVDFHGDSVIRLYNNY